MRRGTVTLAAAALLGIGLPGVAIAADPRGFQGRLVIRHFMEARADDGVAVDGSVDFRGVYELRGFRYRGPGGGPRSYLLQGSGRERLSALANFTKSDPEGSSRYRFSASSNGEVRLVPRPRRARQTSALLLRLRPGGRFELALTPLEGGEPGVPLKYALFRSDEQSCIVEPGTRAGESFYEDGVYSSFYRQPCPNEEGGSTDPRVGKPRQHTIWGADVWASSANAIKQDFCRHITTGTQDLTLCGRIGRGAALRGQAKQDAGNPHFVPGGCPFRPFRPHPIKDGVGHACTVMPVGNPDWKVDTSLSWNLTPIR